MPAYTKLSPQDYHTYQRYYCEGCHQLRGGFGLRGTLTVNYDMTFNTILLDGVMGSALDFEGTDRLFCVLDRPKADSRMMESMAAYTLILTKWELFDDFTDKPSMKSRMISEVLDRAIHKAVDMYPDYDDHVGKGFMALHDLELQGCKNARRMGEVFGDGLVGPLRDIAGDKATDALDEVYRELTAAVYVMDSLDDLEDDYRDGTYNPFLPERFVNKQDFVNSHMFELAATVNGIMSDLQGSYSKVRPGLVGNVSLCDNIVYYGIPESARKVLSGNTEAKSSIKNVWDRRKDRISAID
ncbi:MAG: hypothetical protein IJ856_00175 [Candidatus Methanomethylophilaceae archaeon]|nr:hypothetical protein [Candidatus Methanomethylophilaceae archaeon]